MTVTYPIGIPGIPWGAPERAAWRARQSVQRSYGEVLTSIDGLRDRFEVAEYARLDYGDDGTFPLLAVRSHGWNPALPTMLVTGGVHGYETSGVQGALQFLDRHAGDHAGRVNLLVIPCVSPWAYERIHRWNPDAIDPNRSFHARSPAGESAALWSLLEPLRDAIAMHIDLHETTDSDESEFRPALAARDGLPFEPDGIPDGFYLCADAANPCPVFQQAVISAVEKVTHIAPPDDKNEIIGSPVVAHGVIEYDYRKLGLCAGITNARCTTTTEVYPDSPRATPEQCNAAQVAAVQAAIEFTLAG